ncbi:MAG: ABC transporter ATP-binding protein [Acidobacteriota bacterium]|nr:ABC transporter ATP-binding protein [Acidobacteriota bacterium]
MLEARELSKSFNGVVALDGLNVEVQEGEILCFLGANGAGKTTAINLFLGFLEPTRGEALVKGKSVRSDPVSAREHVAYIPERVALYPDLSGYENLRFFAELAGKRLEESELLECLDTAGLPRDANHKLASTYSKGMQQKVGIACALAKSAEILLLDEPLAGLDPKAANEFCSLLREMRSQGVAGLMATHDLFRAREVASRIGILRDGQLVDVIAAADVTAAQLETLYLEHMHEGREDAA